MVRGFMKARELPERTEGDFMKSWVFGTCGILGLLEWEGQDEECTRHEANINGHG